jgi:beta-glucanase (GH16 family)
VSASLTTDPQPTAKRSSRQVTLRRLLVIGLAMAAGLGVGISAGLSGHAGPEAAPKPVKHEPQQTPGQALTPPLPHLHLAFDGTFSGTQLDPAVWTTCYPQFDEMTGCTNFGNFQEVEWYQPSQAQVSNGILQLIASPMPTLGTSSTGAPKIYPYRSAMITTFSSFRFTYGYVQMVAKLPLGDEFWPALWMLPVNGLALPEIDIVEKASPDPRNAGVFYHPVSGKPQGYVVPTGDLSVGWHTFGLNWEPSLLTWFIDGQPVLTVTTNVPDQPMYLLDTLAATNYVPVCLTHPTASCTGSMDIKSIRVWQTS